MFVCKCVKNTFWLSIGIMFVLFIGFVSTIAVKTVRKGYVCESVPNVTKIEIIQCKGEIAMKTMYAVLSDLFDYYDKNTNITGTQTSNDEENSHSGVESTHGARKREEAEDSPSSGEGPFKLRSYKKFIDCVSDTKCGIISKCYYDLKVNKKYDVATENINGSVFVLKNNVPFHVDYFWDVYGCNEGENIDGYESNSSSAVHHARLSPYSTVYVDSMCYGVHTLRLYVDPNQSVYIGADQKWYTNVSDLSQNPTIDVLEPILTVLSSNMECTESQTCRYLNSVCFSKSKSYDRCDLYGAACNYFTDMDESAKDYCIQDCFYMHHPSCIPPNATLKADSIVQWVCRGGGIEGSPVDGNINSGPVVALAVLFTTTVVILMGTCVSLHVQKKKLAQQEHAMTFDSV